MTRILLYVSLLFLCGCALNPETAGTDARHEAPVIAKEFAYPVGSKDFMTEAKDTDDDWYNAQDFGENDHLGEDWNKNTGGDTDCGEPVYAAGNGIITFAGHAGSGWGNVVIVEHTLPEGKKVQSLYGHLKKILRKEGAVGKRERIGTVGNADGKYLCHLHFELRDESCLMWNRVFIGYSPIRKGWLDPSDFIDNRR